MLGLDVHDMEDLGEVWVGYDGQPKSTQFGLKSLRLSNITARADHSAVITLIVVSESDPSAGRTATVRVTK